MQGYGAVQPRNDGGYPGHSNGAQVDSRATFIDAECGGGGIWCQELNPGWVPNTVLSPRLPKEDF